MNNIAKLYPQYHPCLDRRRNNIPVELERRSGRDRRSSDRVALDTRLMRDIYQVKSQTEKLEKILPRLNLHNVTTQNPTFADKNNFTQDQFVKQSKPDMSKILREEAKLKEKANTSLKMGILMAALAGIIAASFIGPAGIVVAMGSSLYVGSKFFATEAKKAIQENNNDT